MNTNSNTYTIVYASIVVVLVAFLLAFVSSVLKERQNANVELDTKKQILSSLNVDFENADPAALYEEIIKEDMIINSLGDTLAKEGGFYVKIADENAKDKLEDRQLPVFVANVDGATKYVLPVRGNGLWGPIWGYVALDDDKNTIFGVYFSHQGETPGLGAEIAHEKFKKPFHGKHIMRNGEFASVRVVKPGKSDPNAEYVDGLSGGTMTSQGVDAMLMDGLSQYVVFLKK